MSQAQYLERTIDNVTTTMPVQLRVILPVSLPRAGEGRRKIPLRVRVRAAHAEEPFVWTDYLQAEYGPPPV